MKASCELNLSDASLKATAKRHFLLTHIQNAEPQANASTPLRGLASLQFDEAKKRKEDTVGNIQSCYTKGLEDGRLSFRNRAAPS